ncbi:MAG: RNA polymerase sigma factor SigJ [bacterium]
MPEHDWLATQFEQHRRRLRAVAYRMLGSLSEADDAVQESWLRFSRADTDAVQNMGGWLTTIVSRVSLNMLRARATRREEPMTVHVPDPIVTSMDAEHEALLADSVSLAVLVVLETLSPAERLAFVLHDMFAVSFDEIALIVQRSPAATRQLASRARRRVRGVASDYDESDVKRHREVVEAFLAASRGGDFDALVAVLDPDVVLRSDLGSARPGASRLIRGAKAVAENARMFGPRAGSVRHVFVNGAAGFIAFDAAGQPMSVLAFTIVRGKIVEIDALADPDRLRGLVSLYP